MKILEHWRKLFSLFSIVLIHLISFPINVLNVITRDLIYNFTQ